MLEEGAVGALNAESAALKSQLTEQENRIANTLAAALGFPMGPHEVICPECQGGPCRQVEVCRTQAEWGPYTADLLAVQAAERLKSAEGRVKALEEAVRTLHGYSRRYCDGRSSYAPSEHNTITHTLLALGVTLEPDPISTTGPFARDGMYGLTEQDRQALATLVPTDPTGRE